MKRAFVLFAVAILLCNTTLAQEPDPDPNLIWKTENGYNSFVIHPNGNIIASKGLEVAELNGNTGEIIREFPFYFEFYALSKDGKYLAGGIDGLVLIDYETGEIVKELDVPNTNLIAFMPDNVNLLIKTSLFSDPEKQFCLYNYIDDTVKYFTINYSIGIWNFTISPDGKFLAIGGFIYNTGEENKTILMLYDAVTWKPIKNLATFDEDNEVRSIKFSPDSRLVGFHVYAYKLYVFYTENFTLYKYDDSAAGFGFITNDFLAIGGGSFNPPLTFKLLKLLTEEIIYSKINFTGSSEHNPTNNSIVVYDGNLYCLDFEKILMGTSIEPEITNPFIVEYINNDLLIKNYNFNSLQLTVHIADINGKMIRQIELKTSKGELRIPIKLISGTYFLHIKDGGKEYVAKFLVTN